jgi:major type 1 subunit fimbrin (pilin)
MTSLVFHPTAQPGSRSPWTAIGNIAAWLRLLAPAVLGMFPVLASADCTFLSGDTVDVATYSAPASIPVPRDVAIGTVLYTSAMPPDGYTRLQCVGGEQVGYLNGEGPTPPVSGTLFPIPGTGVSWRYMTVSTTNYGKAYGSYSASAGITSFTGSHGIQLVVTGPITPGQVVPAGKAGYIQYGTLETFDMVLGNPITLVPVGCNTPNVTVNLGSHRITELKGVGTYTASTSFNIALNSCPANMNSIRYEIDAVTPVVNSPNSVVALSSSPSSAAGVGVQILDGNGNPFPLDQPVTLSGYTPATGGSYSVPLQARYYQTAASVTPGWANSLLTFTMFYQ